MAFSDEIDAKLLIEAVKNNPCIWNHKLQEYNNKTIKNKAWIAVCEEVVSDFKSRSINEKNAIGLGVQSKWKNIRDAYTRYCRNLRKKSGSAAPTPKEYTYYDQLLFLQNLTEDKNQTISNVDSSSQTRLQPTEEEDVMKRLQKRRSDINDDILFETLSKRLHDKQQKADRQPSPPPDEDTSFLLSLVSDFKKIPDDWKLDAKGQIIQVIKHYRAIATSSTNRSYNSMGNSTHKPESQLSCNESVSSQDFETNTIVMNLFTG